MSDCTTCKKALSEDDIGATRKLINRGAETFYCIPCLAEKFRVEEALLRSKIEEWREQGCMLFPPKE